MAGNATIKVEGVKELVSALQALGKSVGKAALRRVGRKAMEPMAEAARAMAPVDDGYLRDSISIANSQIKSVREGGATMTASGFRSAAKDGVSIYMGTANRNGVPREFGSSRSPAQPFMRPAFDREGPRVAPRIAADLGPEIEKTAARVARKKARKI